MAIRLQDIARDLNLSTMTISKVLRGQTDVSSETKARVLQRVRELNYRPNMTARSLRTGQTHTVGMVLPRMDRGYAPGLVDEVRQTLQKEGYNLIFALTDGDIESEESESELHLGRQVDALLFALRDDAADIPQALKEAAAPVILIGYRPARVTSLCISLRENEVGKFAATHLLERRSRKLAYLRGPRTAIEDKRFSGFLEAMRDAGATIHQKWAVEIETRVSEFAAAREAATRLFASAPRPDGIVCCSDSAAAGVYTAAQESGISVPEQLQIIGIGNAIEICEAFALTSIDLSGQELGRRAARMALRLIRKKDLDSLKSTALSPTLIHRGSTRA